MKTPKHLKHKPIIVVNDYNEKDGKNAPNSDAKALSIGIAQFDHDEFSAKVFRHTGQKWSRQSEELPLHRVLDLAILIVASMHPTQGETKSISILQETIDLPSKHLELLEYFEANKNIFQPRLKELGNLLSKL